MKLNLYLLIFFLTNSYAFVDFKVGHEYKFSFVIEKYNAFNSKNGTEVRSSEKYVGILTLKKVSKTVMKAKWSNLTTEPPSLFSEELLRPFILEDASYKGDGEDADGIDAVTGRKNFETKIFMLDTMLMDYSHAKELLNINWIFNPTVNVELPIFEMCRVHFKWFPKHGEMILKFVADKFYCDPLENRRKYRTKVYDKETLGLTLTYNQDNEQTGLVFHHKYYTITEDDNLDVHSKKYIIKLIGSSVITD